MSALSRNVHCFWFCSTTQKQRLLKESIKIEAKIRENTKYTIHQHVTSEHRTPALGGVSSLSRKCSSLQQEVRGFSSFALFCDWAGGSDQVMSALSRNVHCFWFCSTTQKQRLLKESRKIERNIYHLVKSEKIYYIKMSEYRRPHHGRLVERLNRRRLWHIGQHVLVLCASRLFLAFFD